MRDTENFLSRWSRLKRDSELSSSLEQAPLPEIPTAEAFDPSAAFDPAGLPPIDSIVADSDIRQFLQAGVPPELTRAALRTAWAADPAIRDFVGVAESQWDFNDHSAMPGFGPVRASDYFKAQIVEKLDRISQGTAQTPEAAAQPVQRSPGPLLAKPTDDIEYVAAVPIPHPDSADVPESNLPSRPPHTHGGALPK